MDIGINRPKLLRALLIITALLLTCDHAHPNSSASCANECALCTSSAVAYWPMTSKTKGSDLSGNENHVTFVGLTYTDGPSGEYKGAVHFSGTNNSFASVTKSLSMDVGKYTGFSFSGFVRLDIQDESASLIDWSSSKGYGVFIASSAHNIQLQLYPGHRVVKHKAEFPNMTFTTGLWHFFGISYDKATGMVTAFIDGKQEQQQLYKNIVAGTAKSNNVGIGTDLTFPTKFNYNGDMSCMMLFKVALKADDFERVRKFCCGITSTQTTAPEMSIIDVSRTYNKVTIRWQQVIGHYTIKVKYCQTGTKDCVIYIVPMPGDTSATWFVGPDKTYDYYMMMEEGGDVVYTSERLVAKTVRAAPEMSITDVSRTKNNVTISWKKVIGNYTLIMIKYCQTGTDDCVDYIVPNPDDTSATWFVDPDKTYYFYVMIYDGSDDVYTSDRLVAKAVMAEPEMPTIDPDVSRVNNKITIRWQQVIGHVTAIKVKYCQTDTDHCVYIALSHEDTSTTLFVDPDKTYYYYVMIYDGGDVVYTSARLVTKTVIGACMVRLEA